MALYDKIESPGIIWKKEFENFFFTIYITRFKKLPMHIDFLIKSLQNII